jgi:apolipoprotein D and lipocalin family protein
MFNIFCINIARVYENLHATIYRLFALCASCLLFACTSVPEGVKPVSGFDAQKYIGKWYEVARFDHSFERGLEQVTAEYSFRDDGGINVINRGYNVADGEWEEAVGKAYFVGERDVGHLKVSFFGPFYASYVIMNLDKNNYSYSLVTGPDREYLWILSRTPKMDEEVYKSLLSEARQRGFDVSKLIKVKQTEI